MEEEKAFGARKAMYVILAESLGNHTKRLQKILIKRA